MAEVQPNSNTNNTHATQGSDELAQQVQRQIEYYFSLENLVRDTYLNQQMNDEQYVPIKVIADFPKMKAFSVSEEFLLDVMKKSESVEVDEAQKMVRPVLRPARKTLILTETNLNTPQEVRKTFFADFNDQKLLKIDRTLNNWNAYFENEDDATKAMNQINDLAQKGKTTAKARLRADSYQSSFYELYEGNMQQPYATGPNMPPQNMPFFYPNFYPMGYSPYPYYQPMPMGPPYPKSYRGGNPMGMQNPNFNKGKGPKPNAPTPKRGSATANRPTRMGATPVSGATPATNPNAPFPRPETHANAPTANNSHLNNGTVPNNSNNSTTNPNSVHPNNGAAPQNGASFPANSNPSSAMAPPQGSTQRRGRGGTSKAKSKRKPQTAQVPQFSNVAAFPPLPSQGEEDDPAYTSSFKRYSTEQLLHVMKGMKQFSLPEQTNNDVPVVTSQENTNLASEVNKKKVPKKKEPQTEEKPIETN